MPIKLITDKDSSFKVFIVCEREIGRVGDGDRKTDREETFRKSVLSYLVGSQGLNSGH